MALAGWDENKKLTLTIDSSKIDAELTDFPVLVTLSSGTGQNIFDTSAVFDEFSYSGSLNDDFTGTNGDAVNEKVWRVTGTPGTGTIQNNKLRSRIGATKSNYNTGYHHLTGDFDIQIDWSCSAGIPATNTMYAQLYVYDYSTPVNYMTITVVLTGYGGWRIWTQTYDGTTWRTTPDTVTTSADKKLRLQRVGTTWKTYYDTGGGWTLHKTCTELNQTGEVTYRVGTNSAANNPSYIVDWDNFTATSDGINYYNYDGSRKIAITDANDNQLYTEIERWEKDDNIAELWVKVPTIASAQDTNLYLYYDSTQDDNVHYVGSVDDLDYSLVVDIGAEGTYDTTHTSGLCIIKESDTSYKMWYSGSDGTWRILYATSTDGINWTDHQLVVDINNISYDSSQAVYPYVIKESDSSYKMWYSGNDSTNWRILYAVSTDGTTWSGHQMVVDIGVEGTYDTTGAIAPSVIKESASSYKMWYGGKDSTNWRTLYATSTNGTTWSGHQMVIDLEDEGTYDTSHAAYPYVIKESASSYKMWYGGHGGDAWRGLYATSTNGTTWSNHQMVLDIETEGTYDDTHVLFPYIIEGVGASYEMWYSGHDGTNWRILHSSYRSLNVWDENFVGVYHMNQNPNGDVADAIKDSTPNINQGTPVGTMLTEDLVDGKIGKALDFDGSDDYIDLGTGSDLEPGTGPFTWEAILKSPDMTVRMAPLGKQTQSGVYNGWVIRVSQSGNDRKLHIQLVEDAFAPNRITIRGSTVMADDTEYQCVVSYDGSEAASGVAMMVNGVGETETIESDTLVATVTSATKAHIGSGGDTGGTPFAGIIEEVRFSNIERPTAWLKATYYSNWNNLLNFAEGAEGAVFGQIVVNDEWKDISTVQIVIGSVWKDVSEIQIVKNGEWKLLTS